MAACREAAEASGGSTFALGHPMGPEVGGLCRRHHHGARRSLSSAFIAMCGKLARQAQARGELMRQPPRAPRYPEPPLPSKSTRRHGANKRHHTDTPGPEPTLPAEPLCRRASLAPGDPSPPPLHTHGSHCNRRLLCELDAFREGEGGRENMRVFWSLLEILIEEKKKG